LIDFGTYPDQRRKYFSHATLPRTLQRLFPGRDTAATIDAGIDAVLHGCESENWPGLMRREFHRADGAVMRLNFGLIDAGGDESDTIKAAIRRSPFAANIMPSFGKGLRAKDKPMSQWAGANRNDGPEWRTTKGRAGQILALQFSTNFWKAKFHRALALPPGSQGALYLFKTKNPSDHRMLGEHLRSEKPVEVTAFGRTIIEFSPPRPGSDNHFLDSCVGAMVAASKCGITSTERRIASVKPRKTFREMAASARRAS
jgi:hypothetical protein